MLYTPQVLRLAMETARWPRLPEPKGSAERRAPMCGSRICVDLSLTPQARIGSIGMQVNACALGQASAALLAQSSGGQALADLEAAATGLARWLSGDESARPDWPGIDALAPARDYPARHGAILIPFEAAVEAMRAALAEAKTPA